jgi:succinate dehydrogenase / fumarate reductase cytochrome b subunit
MPFASDEDSNPMADVRTAPVRPLSPHLTVFRFILTMAVSILHRITGGALYFGAALVAIWLIAVASGPEWYALVDGIYSSWFGRLVLIGFVWSLLFHAFGGLRHFTWDLGYGFEKKTATAMAFWSTVASFVLTAVLVVIAYFVA